MAELKKFKELTVTLQRMAAKTRKDTKASVLVGYTASYALFVHENVEMKLYGQKRRKPSKGFYWGPAGQAKFLEQPARMLQPELSKIVATALQKGSTMAQALVLAGLRLQRESQKLVPIDTGNLKNSAFTRLEP
jgi:predicted cobalt transporter CbtA